MDANLQLDLELAEVVNRARRRGGSDGRVVEAAGASVRAGDHSRGSRNHHRMGFAMGAYDDAIARMSSEDPDLASR